MKTRRAVAFLLAILTFAGVNVLMSAGPARAAGCYGSSCTGRDPYAMGCVDSRTYTIESFSVGFTVELRFSPTCNAVWAKATGTTSSNYRASVYGYRSSGDAYPVVVYSTGTPTPGGTYSLMVSFGYWVAACQDYYAWGWGTQRCTGRH